MCECCGGANHALAQSLDEMEFERGLWSAAQYGDLERAQQLLDRGFPVDKRDRAGYTALHYAARNGHLALCTLLLDRGAAINAVTCSGRATPLHRAAAVGNFDVRGFFSWELRVRLIRSLLLAKSWTLCN